MRRYTISEPAFTLVSSGSGMNLIYIAGGSNKLVRVLRWWIKPTDNALATAQGIYVRCRRLGATLTAPTGSTNASPAIKPNDFGDPGATFTAITKGTAIASTTGTNDLVDSGGFYLYNGYDVQVEMPITINPTQAFAFELLNASIQASPNVTVGAEVDEAG